MARRGYGAQTTLQQRATLKGVGVHSGREVSVTLHPAEADSGIYFYRTNLDDGRDREIPAALRYVSATDMCTTVGADGVSVATIEHLMATFRALDVDNAMVEIDGDEVPVMDGSADAFIDAVDQAGIETLSKARRYIRVKKPIRVELGNSFAEFRPYERHAGRDRDRFRQSARSAASPLVPTSLPTASASEMARARTFGFLADVEKLWARGFALGASLENAIVIGEDRVDQSGRPPLSRTSSSATRRLTRSVTSRWRARRSSAATAPIAAATS